MDSSTNHSGIASNVLPTENYNEIIISGSAEPLSLVEYSQSKSTTVNSAFFSKFPSRIITTTHAPDYDSGYDCDNEDCDFERRTTNSGLVYFEVSIMIPEEWYRSYLTDNERESLVKKRTVYVQFDIGAGNSICSPEFVKRNCLRPYLRNKSIQVQGINGLKFEVTHYIHVMISIKGIDINGQPAVHRFDTQALITPNSHIDFILGSNVMIDHNVVVIPDERRVTFFRGEYKSEVNWIPWCKVQLAENHGNHIVANDCQDNSLSNQMLFESHNVNVKHNEIMASNCGLVYVNLCIIVPEEWNRMYLTETARQKLLEKGGMQVQIDGGAATSICSPKFVKRNGFRSLRRKMASGVQPIGGVYVEVTHYIKTMIQIQGIDINGQRASRTFDTQVLISPNCPVDFILGSNVMLDHNIVVIPDERRATFFRGAKKLVVAWISPYEVFQAIEDQAHQLINKLA